MDAKFIPLTGEELNTIYGVVLGEYGKKDEPFLLKDLKRLVEGETYAKDLQARKHSNTAAEYAREILWNYFTGGGTSARVATLAFKAIGRENECNPNWI